jgi:hypothetical protein
LFFTGVLFQSQELPEEYYKWDVFFGRSTVQGTKSFGCHDQNQQSQITGTSIFTHHLLKAFRQSNKEMVGFNLTYPYFITSDSP